MSEPENVEGTLVEIDLDAELLEAVERVAETHDLTISDVITAAVQEYLQRRKATT